MILSDVNIRSELKHGNLIVDPPPTPEKIRPASLDVTLARSVHSLVNCATGVIDTRSAPTALNITHEYQISDSFGFILYPQHFILAATVERVTIPSSLVAVLNGRSSLGRLGILVHATAGYIDPGFSGNITLELYNAGPHPVRLYAGMRIAQLVFHTLVSPCEVPYGQGVSDKYKGEYASGPVPSRIYHDGK